MKKERPIFEIGPKCYLYGQEALRLARFADTLVEKYDVDIIFTAQYSDLRLIAEATEHIQVFAQHMDWLAPGRGLGAVLPEAVQDAGAVGVMLNHTECPLSLSALNKTIKRARELQMATIVCADTLEEGLAIAKLGADMVLVEAPDLIGGGERDEAEMRFIHEANHKIHHVSEKIRVIHGAGIKTEKDVYEMIAKGADGTGSTSGIILAEDPLEMTERMVKAVRQAYDSRRNNNEVNGGKI